MRRSSPFVDPAWAQASQNLATIIAGNPEGKAQYEAALTDIKSTQQADRFKRENRGYMDDASNALMLGDAQGAVNNIVRTGENWGDIGSVLQAHGGARLADGEITEDQQLAYMSGAGNAGDADTALSYGRADAISGRDAWESQRETVAKQALANRSTLEGAVVQDSAPGVLSDPDSLRSLTMALNADSVSPENVLAGSMQTGDIGVEEGVRIDDPLSADETIAGVLSDQPGQLAYHRWGNGPDADANAAALDAANGGGGDEETGYDPLDQTRISTLQEGIEPALANYLMDMGAPTAETDDGTGLDYGALPPELAPTVERMAADMMQQDIDARRGVRPASFYVTEAAKALEIEVAGATGGDDWIPFNEDPAAVSWNRNGQQQQQGGGGPAPGTVEDGFRFLGGDPSNPQNWEQVQ